MKQNNAKGTPWQGNGRNWGGSTRHGPTCERADGFLFRIKFRLVRGRHDRLDQWRHRYKPLPQSPYWQS
jgi:hypothetical protein